MPHYVTGTTNPKAQRALLEHLQHVTGVPTRSAGLSQAVVEWEAQVNSAVAEDVEASAYVRSSSGTPTSASPRRMTSGDDLAAEFERFLREQRDEDERARQTVRRVGDAERPEPCGPMR